ncbi:hypothetical protein RxyAA322_22760 [Rubrobacter xylanophilus]|uniref:Uncharacterized protein n=1 Tax=Rubrobacter xylanophilus TaxID=49319 RepID=A0A510HKB9_9ACTN|nr:hypothetical protein RxyAA322_22760 [Rubrobacter xylanophilus]
MEAITTSHSRPDSPVLITACGYKKPIASSATPEVMAVAATKAVANIKKTPAVVARSTGAILRTPKTMSAAMQAFSMYSTGTMTLCLPR